MNANYTIMNQPKTESTSQNAKRSQKRARDHKIAKMARKNMDVKNNVRSQNHQRKQSASSAKNLDFNMNVMSTFVPSCQMPCDTTSAPNSFVEATANPFNTQLNANPFTVNCSPREFIPSADGTQFPLTMNSTFVPTTTFDCSFDDSVTLEEDSQSDVKRVTDDKYKTELCKNWIENGSCRYGKKCQFAHGKEEQSAYANTDEKQRTKNCRAFYQTKQCMYGSRCMFRHEHRHFNQIHRHYYYGKLYALESLYQYSKDQENFMISYETGVHKLPIFDAIHAQGAEEEDDLTASECASYDEDSSLSFIEMEEDIIAFCDPDIKSPTPCAEESALNSTIGSSQESSISAEVAHKLEGDSMAGVKASCFDIAAQMNLAIEEDNDLSFDSALGVAF